MLKCHYKSCLQVNSMMFPGCLTSALCVIETRLILQALPIPVNRFGKCCMHTPIAQTPVPLRASTLRAKPEYTCPNGGPWRWLFLGEKATWEDRRQVQLLWFCCSQLADTIRRPRYDRSRISPGFVHIGVGGFNRSHLAVYLDDPLGCGGSYLWGISGVIWIFAFLYLTAAAISYTLRIPGVRALR